MQLICNTDELNTLIQASIIEPQGNNEFILYSKADLKGHSYPINVTTDTTSTVQEIVSKKVNNSIYTVDKWVNLIKDEFPTNTGKLFAKEGRNLRTGNKARMTKLVQKLIDESYNMTAVVEAVKYEVWWRVKVSTSADNKLDFMQGVETWLNNTTNIDAMIERSQESNEYQMSINQGNESSGTKRKVKLS